MFDDSGNAKTGHEYLIKEQTISKTEYKKAMAEYDKRLEQLSFL